MSTSFRLQLRTLPALLMIGLWAIAPMPAMSAPKTAEPTAKSVRAAEGLSINIGVDEAVSITLPAPAASVFIANPDIADIQVSSPATLAVFGKKTGETTLMASDEMGHTIYKKTVVVQQDLSGLRQAIRAVIPNAKIGADAVPGGIILTGEAKDASMSEDARRLAMRYVGKDGEVINRIKVINNNQIHIRVRFAEVTRTADKRLGVNWENVGNLGVFSLGVASGETVLSDGANLLNRYRPTTDSNTNSLLSATMKNNHFNINGTIDALAEEGLVNILAEPNLTALSGETASFLAGGEFPVPVPQSQTSITIEWKQYGVSLAFTPTLIGGNRINMHIRPEVSQLSSEGEVTLNGITVPALTTRRAETTLELASGQSFVLGGLLNNSQKQTLSKYPFIGDIPVLGALFRSTRYQNDQTELVIIITPYVVKPADEQLATPMDHMAPPNEVERMWEYRTSSQNGDARTMSGTPTAIEPEAPLPAPAPRAPVDQTPAPILPPRVETKEPTAPAPETPVAASAPVITTPAAEAKTPAPAPAIRTSLLKETPAGAGGFILE